MSTIAMSEGWPLEQLIKLRRSQPALVHRALQRLLGEDEDLRWSVVISTYLDEEISLARAASLLGLHPHGCLRALPLGNRTGRHSA